LDGKEITNEQFYDKLDGSDTLPTTSQVTPGAFIEAFTPFVEAGDEIVGIFISSGISGTYDSACMAKETLASGRIHIVDSRNATLGLALLANEAAKLRDAGASAAEIAEGVTALTKKVRMYAVINNLKYLRKGGRISATTAVIGELVGVKPLMSIIDGTVQSLGKARGMTAAINALLQKALADLPDIRYGAAFAHACAPELMKKVIDMVKEPLKLTDWLICSVGSVIGTHTGRGVVGFAYIAE
jgi:DegV family protein with EDD domain